MSGHDRNYLCEWCNPSLEKFVAEYPCKCKVQFCGKCNANTWHAPKSEVTE